LGRGREVGRAADEPRDVPGDGVQDLRRGVAAGEALRVGGESRNVFVPAVGQLALLHAYELVCEFGMCLFVIFELREPLVAQTPAARANAALKVLAHLFGDEELGVFGPAVGALRQANRLLAERLASGGF